jgi:hypothetical protein
MGGLDGTLLIPAVHAPAVQAPAEDVGEVAAGPPDGGEGESAPIIL